MELSDKDKLLTDPAECLLRRVPIRLNGEPTIRIVDGKPEPTSLTFRVSKNFKTELSVDRKIILSRLGQDGLECVRNDASEGGYEYCLLRITNAQIQAIDLYAVEDGLPDNPAHALIKGEKIHTKSTSSKLARSAEWEIPPTQAQLNNGSQ